jgi:hypothetical protein
MGQFAGYRELAFSISIWTFYFGSLLSLLGVWGSSVGRV